MTTSSNATLSNNNNYIPVPQENGDVNKVTVAQQAPQNVDLTGNNQSSKPEVAAEGTSTPEEGHKGLDISTGDIPITYAQKYLSKLFQQDYFTENQNGDGHAYYNVARASQPVLTNSFQREFEDRHKRRADLIESNNLFAKLDNNNNQYTFRHNSLLGNMRFNNETNKNESIDANGEIVEIGFAANFPDNSWQFERLKGATV